MELWIRSQDRLCLAKADLLVIEDNEIRNYVKGSEFYEHFVLGTYKTKERALEVLDEIQRKLDYIYELSLRPRELTTIEHKIVYEMPKE